MWNYNGFSKLQLDLIKERVIDLSGEVDIEMAKFTREALLRLKAEGSPDIEVRITSGGGSVKRGLDTYDMLRMYEGKTRGIVFGEAASMAVVILQACTQRHAAKHSSVLIHHISAGQITLDDIRKHKRVAKIREDMERDQQRLYDILSKRTKKTVRLIRLTCAKDKPMTAEEALQFGLLDEVM